MPEKELVTETLCFKIDGEWITEFVRNLFWIEDKPYPECEEILIECLGTDQITLTEKKVIAQEIIEGRKKLVGVNEFTLEDDNENIRPLSVKFEEMRRKLKIRELHDRMNVHMIDFVDPYSTVKSIAGAKKYDVTSIDQCRTWFWYEDNWIEYSYMRPYQPENGILPASQDDTYGGLWLYDYPDIAYDAIIKSSADPADKIMKHDFWKAVYEIITERRGFKSKDFERRNESYLASVRMRKEKEERLKRLYPASYGSSDAAKKQDDDEEICLMPSSSERKIELDSKIKDVIEFTDKWLAENKKPARLAEARKVIQYDTIRHINSALKDEARLSGNHDAMYLILPDNYNEWEGLIAPNGDFYSCDFGGHNAKAYHIICAYPSKFPNLDYENLGDMNMTNALDFILEQGWCATRYLPICGCYINAPKSGRFTKAQKDAIFDAKIKHDVSVDLGIIGY